MNKQQKEVQQAFLDNEKAVMKKLEENYQDALFEIDDRLAKLLGRDDADMQNVIYQIEYQKALKSQVQGILEQLHANEFETVSEYLAKAYDEGFLGTMYDLQGQGIPLVIPINQEQVVAAIQHETKLSEGLYEALGKDTSRLSRQIAGEISRGISNAATYNEMARNIASFCSIPKNNAARIARTEAHRIQCKATADAQWKAKSKGADVLKQWDSTLDDKTRPTHRELNGQIRELDQPFTVEGKTAMQPGDFGDPSEDCNCRCALLQRARWALEADIATTKWDASAPEVIAQDGSGTRYVDISDAKNYAEFKKIYNGLAAKIGDEGIPDHEEPVLVKKIDYFNKNAVNNELKNFEKSAINESIETACVVTKEGEVFNCFGTNNSVFPDFDLKDKLKGSSVSHNHPINETEYSFSKKDLQLFADYELDLLRGCDKVYTYELNRNANDIDESLDDWFSEENFQHCIMIDLAKEYGFGYRRWKNE